MNEIGEKVFKALDNPEFKWRTIKGITDETGLDFEVVYDCVCQNRDQIVESVVPDVRNRPLYTTRANWLRQATWWDHIRAILRNRIG